MYAPRATPIAQPCVRRTLAVSARVSHRLYQQALTKGTRHRISGAIELSLTLGSSSEHDDRTGTKRLGDVGSVKISESLQGVGVVEGQAATARAVVSSGIDGTVVHVLFVVQVGWHNGMCA